MLFSEAKLGQKNPNRGFSHDWERFWENVNDYVNAIEAIEAIEAIDAIEAIEAIEAIGAIAILLTAA